VAGKQRFYRDRIKSTQALKKIFRAMELMAASRIGRARAGVEHAGPYSRAMTRAVSAVVGHAEIDHPLTRERPESTRTAVLLVTADRGMAGAYSASVLREGERLMRQLADSGADVDLYVTGRRAVSYFSFRRRELARKWTGLSDAPTVELAEEIATTLLGSFLTDPEEGGVGQLYVVYTHFVNMVTQTPRVIRMLPLEVVEDTGEPHEDEPIPLYEFEPSPEVVLDALLPQYVRTRLHSFLLQSAASELAARQRAMHTATDNAEDLIRTYTRQANQARQSEITQEISEIVSGSDALASS
jgi:F-type H+-transporting ATPase subunit gamma